MSDQPTLSPGRPEVIPDGRSQEFFEGCARGVLLIQRCGTCQGWAAPSHPFCALCGHDALHWEEASGTGRIHTFGIVHHLSHPGFAGEAPYNVAVVELAEGPRLNTNIVGCDNAEIRVGMPVRVQFIKTGSEVFVPVFAPS